MEKQIHKKTIINIETDVVVYDEVELWDGPVAEAGKAPKIKMAQPPPPTQEEIEARQMGNFLSRAQLNEMGYYERGKMDPEAAYEHYQRYGKNEGRVWEGDPNDPDAAAKYYEANPDVAQSGTFGGSTGWRKRAQTKEEKEQEDLESQIMKRFKDELGKRPGEVSPEQESALNELYGSEQSKMDEELKRFAVEQSGARGLSMSDTPYARELLLAKGRGQTELGSARASSKLNFAERERLFNQGLAQWRGDLQQQRLANLMGATGQQQNTAIGFMNARGNLKPTPYQTGGSGGGFRSIMGGIGGALGGLFGSSVEFKDNIKNLSPKVVKQLVTALLTAPVQEWQYKNTTIKHIGPMTEYLPAQVVTKDGLAISIIDMLGALLLTIQQLSKRVESYAPIQ